MLKGKEEFADKLMAMLEKEAIEILLTSYDPHKSFTEIDAEGILRTLHAQRFDVAKEYMQVKAELKTAILRWLEVLGT